MDISTENLSYYWAIFGIILVLAEGILPGLIVIFLGLAAFIVAFFIQIGWIAELSEILTLWFISSLVLLLTVRNVFAKLAPGDTETSNTDEDIDAIGKIVKIQKTITPTSKEGRINFRGSTWPATSTEGTLQVGQDAELVSRDGGVWVVKKP